uniref:MARVEL domain-containing protein n=1 Tax=Neogobius melanostomus TaxID=47308 RepID=A0A8C6U7F9_9GOBI
MIRVDLRALTQPIGILRIVATILTCISFSLVASVGYVTNSYWSWCMFTWCFCFIVSLTIIIMEFTTIHTKAPFGWEDFTAAFAMLASLMIFTASIMYPSFFTCKGLTPSGPPCHRQIGASVLSWICVLAYVGEVVLTRIKPQGENIGFLSTLPGIMKMLETFIACIIFTSMDIRHYSKAPELEWCVSVYSLCFIFAIAIIVICTAQLTSYSPISFEKVVIVYNIMATLMYISAMVIWPLYGFRKNLKPPDCGYLCSWDKLVVITIMSIFNTIVYILDSAYSIYLVFFVGRE